MRSSLRSSGNWFLAPRNLPSLGQSGQPYAQADISRGGARTGRELGVALPIVATTAEELDTAFASASSSTPTLSLSLAIIGQFTGPASCRACGEASSPRGFSLP